jgi:hypothetical protein
VLTDEAEEDKPEPKAETKAKVKKGNDAQG